jgi:hypothetical protein
MPRLPHLKRSLCWPIVMLISASGAGLSVASGMAAPVRPAIILWFFLICPGMAFVRLLGIKEHVTELTIAVALSIALDVIVSETMVLINVWSPERALLTLVSVSIFGAALQLTRLPARHSAARDGL